MNTNIWQKVDEEFRNYNISSAIEFLEGELSQTDARKFSCLIGLKFKNSPEKSLKELNKFISKNDKKFPVKSVYLEMNGFDINYDRWYFDLFAFNNYSSDYDDLDWLCEWQSENWREIALRGMEKAQSAFAWYHEERIWKRDPEFKTVYEVCMLLVMAKFVQLIEISLNSGKLIKQVPVLATAHEFESIGRFEP